MLGTKGEFIGEGGGAAISSFPGEKAWGQKEILTKYKQSQGCC
jgi:hypothetical protein